jgi:hypothetical protein
MIKNRSLKDCPWIFALHEGHDNVIDMIYRDLTEWYVEQEFGVAAKPQKQVVNLRG